MVEISHHKRAAARDVPPPETREENRPRRPPPRPPPGCSASRRTSQGWGPAVRGEQSGSCAGQAGARTRRYRPTGGSLTGREGQAPTTSVALDSRANGLLPRLLLPERDHAGDLPLVPHLVHLGLEVAQVLLDEVGET